MRRTVATLLVLAAMALAQPAQAQVGRGSGPIDGHLSLLFDVLPDIDPAPGRQAVAEARVRLFLERRLEIGEHVRLNLAGYVDSLVASRAASRVDGVAVGAGGVARAMGAAGVGAEGATSVVRDAVFRPADLYAEFVSSRFDLRIGASRLVWGRLDEFQPTDVVNPIDLSRFLLEGRTEARLPVGLVRGRAFLPGSTTLEAVVVPAFRAGRFDQLDEATSPFNLSPQNSMKGLDVSVVRDEPEFGLGSVQGGARVTTTLRRVDVGASVYRGLRSFAISTVEGPQLALSPLPVSPLVAPRAAPLLLTVVQSFPRFTMVGGDFEAVRGQWGLRGEVAAFVDDELQSTRAARGVPGSSIEGGVGVDRRAGSYRVAVNALLSHRSPDRSDVVGAGFVDDDEVNRTDVSLVAAVDRSFVNDTRTLRVFTVYDPADRTTFARVIGAVSLRDNLWLEGSGGLFAGSSLDTIGRLTHRDFAYARLRVFF